MFSQLKEEKWNQTMRPKGKNAEYKSWNWIVMAISEIVVACLIIIID